MLSEVYGRKLFKIIEKKRNVICYHKKIYTFSLNILIIKTHCTVQRWILPSTRIWICNLHLNNFHRNTLKKYCHLIFKSISLNVSFCSRSSLDFSIITLSLLAKCFRKEKEKRNIWIIHLNWNRLSAKLTDMKVAHCDSREMSRFTPFLALPYIRKNPSTPESILRSEESIQDDEL